MSLIESYVDYTMAVGQSKREVECDRCIGQGNSPAVQVTRKEDGFLVYCFRCNKTYFVRDTNASPAQVMDMLKNKKVKKYDGRPEVITLPTDFTNKLPPLALVDLYTYEITNKDIKFFNIGWSPELQRTIFPFYKYHGQYKTGLKLKLVGWSGKKLSGDDNDKKPKWSTVRQKDVKHLKFIAVTDGPPVTPGHVVLVEDPLSAIRVSEAGYLCIGLHTTYLPDSLMPKLRQTKMVHIWLDEDARDKAVKYVGKLGANGIKSRHIYTQHDPKAYSRKEILDNLSNDAY